MTFAAPAVLVLGLLVVAGLAVAVLILARRRTAALAAAGVGTAARGPALGIWFVIAGLALLAVSSAGPTASVPVPRSAGTVILAMDVSGSMAADDVRPTRLAAAKRAAKRFVAAQPDTVDVGVVAFERGARTTARPDRDHGAALAAIDRLKVTGGTSLGEAVLASLSAITGRTVALRPNGDPPDIGTWPSATIVVFSDGEDQERAADAAAAARVAQDAGVHIDTVGIGTTRGAVVDVDGYRIRTALHENTLTALAKTTGGQYHPASDAAAVDRAASSVDLRLTVADERLPLAGAGIAVALLLLGLGAVLTLLATGRLV